MKDIEGNEFQVGDWLRGDDQFGKVTNVEADKLTYVDDTGAKLTLKQADVEDYNIMLFHYSSVRRRYLANKLPADFFTANSYPEGADQDAYDRLYFFGDQLAEASWNANVDLDEVIQKDEAAYNAAVGKALTDNEDLDGFMKDMTEWFRKNG